MEDKQCFKCLRVLPRTSFYAHSRMGDGLLGKCKDCAKADVKKNYQDRRQQYSEYEKERNRDPDRRARKNEYGRRHREKYPDKTAARTAVGNAIRDGKLIRPDNCQRCGASCKVEAHHKDYSKPLDVDWYCFQCHREVGHGQVVSDRDYKINDNTD